MSQRKLATHCINCQCSGSKQHGSNFRQPGTGSRRQRLIHNCSRKGHRESAGGCSRSHRDVARIQAAQLFEHKLNRFGTRIERDGCRHLTGMSQRKQSRLGINREYAAREGRCAVDDARVGDPFAQVNHCPLQ